MAFADVKCSLRPGIRQARRTGHGFVNTELVGEDQEECRWRCAARNSRPAARSSLQARTPSVIGNHALTGGYH